MKILVTVKRVIDSYSKIRIKPDQTGVDTQHVKMSMNPFDSIAVEEAVRLREQNNAAEVIVISIGNEACQETLRQALAMGADRAIFINYPEPLCSLHTAKILQKIVRQEQSQLVLMGKQSIDSDNNQTPQMLAALLDWPQAAYVSKLAVNGASITVIREIDEGLETLQLIMPAVISTDLRLNNPRYITLPNIMKAKQKAIERIEFASLGLQLTRHQQVLTVTAPPERKKGMILPSAAALIDKLKYEEGVIS